MFNTQYSILNCNFRVLPIDLGARYASLIFGLSVMPLSLGYTLNPIVMGIIVPNHVRKYFFVAYEHKKMLQTEEIKVLLVRKKFSVAIYNICG